MSILSDLQEEAPFYSPARMASKLLSACCVNDYRVYNPPTPIYEICDKLGVKVLRADTGSYFSKLVYHKFPPTIYLHTVTTRQSSLDFSTAHAIGHIIMNKNDIDEISEKPVQMEHRSKDPKELMCQEANKFAACLLVPEWALAPYVMVPGITAPELAKRFKVHVNVINWQLGYL